ncbi:MAG: hypothetical protein ACM3N5_10060 [Candidatus Eiseniibacteriota bacterium]
MTGRERLADRAVMLPIVAFLLLTPPILGVFAGDGMVLGIPVLFLYAFAIWAVLIVLGRALALRLHQLGPESAAPGADGDHDR